MCSIESRLKKIRITLGKTQSQMAKILKVGKATMQNYEYGSSKISTSVVQRLKDLGFDSSWLLYGKGAMYDSGLDVSESANFPPEFSKKFLCDAFDKMLILHLQAGKEIEKGVSDQMFNEINSILQRAQTERETEIMLDNFLSRIKLSFK